MIWDVPQDGMDPTLIADLEGIKGDWAVTSGLRTQAQQEADWEKGRALQPDGTWAIVNADAVVTNSPPGHSAHEFGLAVDVARIATSRERVWDYKHPAWAEMWNFIDQSPRMHGGWHFPVADPDHVQSVGWWKKKQELMDAGKW